MIMHINNQLSPDDGSGWLYFLDSKLYRIREDGSGRTALCEDCCASAVMAGDWIYYPCARFKTTAFRR